MKKNKLFIDGEVLVSPHFSGIGHYTLELLRAIDEELENRKHYSVSLFVYFKQLEKAKSYRFKNIRIVPSLFSQRVSNGLKSRKKQIPLDLFFGKGTYFFPNFSSWPLLYSKNVTVIYDLSFEKYPQFAEPRNRQFLSEQVLESVKRADHIATISKNAKYELSKFYDIDSNTIGVYYPAVDTKVFRRVTDTIIARTQAKYSIPSKYVLFVGNIEPRKNLKNLLLAYEKLPRSTQNKHSLVLVGAKGWQDDEIFNIINRLKAKSCNVVFPSSYVEDKDLPAIYSGASVFVYPSIYEGFGIPPLEAMACGVPVICADNSSLPEAVGESALMVDALSVKDISGSIQEVLDSKELGDKLIKSGHAQVSKFSWHTSANNLLNSLEEL